MRKYIEIINLGKTYYRYDGLETEICRNLNLTIEKGKIYSIVGDSGCGKTTLINMIAGFENYQKGKIVYFSEKHCNVGIIFQENVLFPWKTVMGNMLFSCKKLYQNPQNVIWEQLRQIGLSEIADCYPNELSGGMQQRIALLRVLLTKPELVILDEAFGALDFKNRMHMQNFFLEYHKKIGFTAIVVTHDLYEACMLGDKMWILKDKPFVCEEIELQGKDITDDLIAKIKERL